MVCCLLHTSSHFFFAFFVEGIGKSSRKHSKRDLGTSQNSASQNRPRKKIRHNPPETSYDVEDAFEYNYQWGKVFTSSKKVFFLIL